MDSSPNVYLYANVIELSLANMLYLATYVDSSLCDLPS